MKTNSTLILVVRILAFVLLCLYSILVFGQADNSSVNATSPLQKFSAVVNEKNIKLQFTLFTGNDASSVTIEKGYAAAGEFHPIAEYWVNMEGNHETQYKWSDATKGKRSIYYRLKITEANGKILYSDILHFNGQKRGDNLIAVLTSLPNSNDTAKR